MKTATSKKHTARLLDTKISYWVYNPQASCTIVMVHGFRGDHHGLEDIIAELPASCRVIVPDLPGFGESEPLKQQAHDVKGYVDFLLEFIKNLKQAKPPMLLGHSFGSIIATHFAAEHSNAIEKLVLVNPIASPALKGPKAVFSHLTVFYYWLGNKLPEKAGRALLSNKAIVLTMSALLAKTKDRTLRRHIHKNHLAHFSSFQSRQVVLESFKASVNHTVHEKAEHVTVPTLLIAGEIDDIAPIKGQRELARTMQAQQLVIIPKVGHLIHHEAPQEAAKAITTFCKS